MTLTDEAREDIQDMDGSARKIVLRGLKKLETEPEKRGQPLGSQASGDLTGLRKLVVGDRDYRIVYHVNKEGDVCVVWVVAKRADSEVYELAKARISLCADGEVKATLSNLVESLWPS